MTRCQCGLRHSPAAHKSCEQPQHRWGREKKKRPTAKAHAWNRGQATSEKEVARQAAAITGGREEGRGRNGRQKVRWISGANCARHGRSSLAERGQENRRMHARKWFVQG